MKRYKPRPYIGVTGLQSQKELEELASFVLKPSLSDHNFMFGFTCSNKRLEDPSSSGKTSPSIETLAKIFGQPPGNGNSFIMPMVHYFTPNLAKLSDEIFQLWDHIGITNLQLNALWPNIDEIRKIREEAPVWITLQLPKEALEEGPIMVAERLRNYVGLVNYALVDPSGGLAKELSMGYSARCLEALDRIPGITPGIAGGLGPDNVRVSIARITELMHCEYCSRDPVRKFCIDAQGKLRDETGLNMEKTKKYLEEAVSAMEICLED